MLAVYSSGGKRSSKTGEHARRLRGCFKTPFAPARGRWYVTRSPHGGRAIMRQLVTDELWRGSEPHLPRHPHGRKGGRPRADDRKCLEGVAYVLRTGCQWRMVPDRQFGVSGSTCWRRFDEWT